MNANRTLCLMCVAIAGPVLAGSAIALVLYGLTGGVDAFFKLLLSALRGLHLFT